MVLAIVAPGQGAQVPGFLAPWLALPQVPRRLGWLSACAGLDLAHYGSEADRDAVLAKLQEHGLVAATENGAGQIVAGGTLDQLAMLQKDPPEGARLRPLEVAGAFHTEHMAAAVSHLATLASAVSTHDPRTRLLSNRDGAVVHDGRAVMRRIVEQVASPVRWDLCMRTMADLGVTGLLEL